jgi:branched-chain amino acid transport system permease protein
VTVLKRLRLPTQPLLRHLLLGIGGAGIVLLLTALLSPYNDFQVAQIALYAIALAGLSLLTGVSGQISLGNGAFMAIGAYTAAEFYTHDSLPLVIPLLAAVGVSAVVGLLIGLPATRLRGPYLAGLTLALALALPDLALKYSSASGGEEGLVINPPTPPGSVNPERWLSWVALACAIVVLVLVANLLHSRFGRTFRAVRDNDVAASLAGIHTARTRVSAFAVSAGCAGLAGGLLGLCTGIVNPAEFNLSLSISLLTGMMLGGMGSLMGVWWGAIVIVYVPQWSNSLGNKFNLSSGVSSNIAIGIFGLVLVVTMMVAPSGIQGGLHWLWLQVRRATRRRTLPLAPEGSSPAGP